MSMIVPLLVLFLAAPKSPAVRFVNPAGLAKSPRYSHVAVVTRGKMIFISGQVAQDARGNLVGAGDMRAQTRQVFENLRMALEAVGAGPKDVVKLTTYVTDMSQLEGYRDARQEFFKTVSQPPTSTLIGVTRLVQEGYLLEVEAIAVVP